LVANKIDVVGSVPQARLKSRSAEALCSISALTGAGIDGLLEAVGTLLDQGKERFEVSFPAAQGGLLSLLRERGRIVAESYDGDEIHVTALITPKLAGQMRKWLRRGAAPLHT
jgi:GTPase